MHTHANKPNLAGLGLLALLLSITFPHQSMAGNCDSNNTKPKNASTAQGSQHKARQTEPCVYAARDGLGNAATTAGQKNERQSTANSTRAELAHEARQYKYAPE